MSIYTDISANIYVISAGCVYQKLVTKICNEVRISYILTNFISNICALNSKHFTYLLLTNGPPSAGQTMKLHHLKSQVQAFYPALKNSFNIGAYWRTYTRYTLIYLRQLLSCYNDF